MRTTSAEIVLRLRAGDLVEVRPAEEILATLDTNGALDALPFMPEMLQYCGKQFRVYKRANKTCDTITPWSLRRLENSVHLEGLRCDGAAHGGCQAGCLLFWKEAWLRRARSDSPAVPRNSRAPRLTLEVLHQKTRKSSNPVTPEEDVFTCQATELQRFSVPMSVWDVRHYIQDLISGNVPFTMMVRSLGILLFNQLQRFRKGGEYPMWFRSHARPVVGRTPAKTLGLKAGDFVQINDRDDILNTLDVRERNRGLSFDREMVKYCGGKYRVLRRVEKILNERTGKMMNLPNDCIMLEGVICVGDLHGFCPRSIYSYWREIWLRRVE